MQGPIGVFDSGYGGLTVLKEFVKLLPQYDYRYLGDNARAPYGPRSFDTVYQYTLQAVQYLFSNGCPLVILACNTASAKALRTIQQNDLIKFGSQKRVLGVIRPTSEIIGDFSKSKHVGVMATVGTVASRSYLLEIEKFFPEIVVHQEACPMWVPLIENNEHESEAMDYFIKKNINNLLNKSSEIDVVLLACTHYPILIEKIRGILPERIRVISQGEIVAKSLMDYLVRHSEIDNQLSKTGKREFFTTDTTDNFDLKASLFLGEQVKSKYIKL